jgi:hypothetical protein
VVCFWNARKKISGVEIRARAEIDLRSAAKMKRFQVVARNRMTSASGFTWFAREPELIVGAEGARILTEINRLPQPPLLAPSKKSNQIYGVYRPA